MIQLIFVVETTEIIKSDDRYIDKLIHSRYDFSSNNFKRNFVHMGGKTKYNSGKVISDINDFIKENKKGDNKVIYCIDTDRINYDRNEKNFFEKVKKYCKLKGYYLIWFNYTIEYVLLGRKVDNNKKKQEATRYHKQERVAIPTSKLLSLNEEEEGHSNIFRLLDTILPEMK